MVVAVIKDKLSILKTGFSLKLFLAGLAAIIVVYAAIIGLFYLKASGLEQRQISSLPSKTTIIRTTQFVTAVKSYDAEGTALNRTPNKEKAEALTAVPVQGLYEEVENGIKPIIREIDGLTPFDAYKRPFDLKIAKQEPIISLGLVEFGISKVASEKALKKLPPEISFIISPYTPNNNYWIRQARSYGHEIWLILPMETKNYPRHDFGSHTLLTQTPIRENLDKLDWLLSSTVGYVGFITPYDATFIESLEDVRPIFGELASRGLGFINTTDFSSAVTKNIYLSQNAPYGQAPIWLDQPPSKEEIREKLQKLEEEAKKKGQAAAIFNALPLTYEEILIWSQTLEEKGILLAPLSVEAEL